MTKFFTEQRQMIEGSAFDDAFELKIICLQMSTGLRTAPGLHHATY
jgi:hypothetical protein